MSFVKADRRTLLVSGAIIVLGLAIDQIVKSLCVTFLQTAGRIVLIDGIFALVYTENTGAAFGFMSNMTGLLTIIRIVGITALVWFLLSGRIQHMTGTVAIAMIITGGLGNLIDLPLYGHVVDMFEFLFINFAIFNVADCFITCGVPVLAVYMLKFHKWEK